MNPREVFVALILLCHPRSDRDRLWSIVAGMGVDRVERELRRLRLKREKGGR